ncbi:MAG: DUF6069 family protein [Aggregatilineales bacterium]
MTVSTSQKPSLPTLWRNGLIVAVIATLVNGLIFLVGSTFSFPPDAIHITGVPVTIAPIMIGTFAGGVLATAYYTVLMHFFERNHGNRIMWRMTILVFIVMFFSPFAIQNAPVSQILIMEGMHFVAGLPPVIALTRTAA